jgi:drug/metabolite transporter (DMT)-like permease
VGSVSTLALTLGALVCFAANSLLARAALGSGLVDAATFTSVRLASGAVFLAVLAGFRRGVGARPAGSWGSGLVLFAYGATFSLAYRRIPTAVGALALFAAVQATMVGFAVARGDRPRPAQWTGILLALAGLASLALPGARAPDLGGTGLMVVAGVAWGAYTLRARGAADPVTSNGDNFLRSLPAAAAFSLLDAARISASGRGLLLAAASGALASGGGYCLWYAVAPRLGPTRAAAVQLAVPLLAGAGAVVLLGEPLTLRLVGAGTAILGGIGLAAWSAPPTRR